MVMHCEIVWNFILRKSAGNIDESGNVALHELDFFLYFSLENSILSCHSRPTTYFAAPKKTAIFIYDILTSK